MLHRICDYATFYSTALARCLAQIDALPAGTRYYKWGPTPGNPTPHWYEMPATISGATASFTITDGGLGDDDLAINGTIVDQGGAGVGAAGGVAAVPTLSAWALMLMAALLALAGLRRGR